eukprot:TRINITY_DN64593_c0_g1_i1.p1 TRINITY_DN64593_c0_g1~~TRINITY_DN64593_c0_g1_i1.p1  ORF type:complete len:515 (+),score=58.99 TRINITY_DN64593_c0_g1_i1:90-1634(+)
MGSNLSFADNQEVEHTSGASRLASSFFAAVCLAPLLILGMTFMVGYNEQLAVCDAKAISAGAGAVSEIGCTSASEKSGSLVFFNCDLKKEGLPQLSIGGDFSGSYPAIGIKVEAMMYQCVEHARSESKKDLVGGGKTTVTTYTYAKEWVDHYVDSHSFKKQQSRRENCGGIHNPTWSSEGLPQSKETYADRITAGPYTISDSKLINRIPLDSPLDVVAPSSKWKRSGNTFQKGSGQKIGDVRITFKTNDWSQPGVTVVGQNSNGKIIPWKSPGAWLCSGNTVHALRPGQNDKESMFESMQGEIQGRTWILRLIGFLVLWCGFSLLFAPLGVMADCIPCIGPCLGDSIEAVACVASCLPATACFMVVAGLVWCLMRPMIAIPVLLVAVIIMLGSAYRVYTQRKTKADGGEPLQTDVPSYGAAQAMMASPPQQATPMVVTAQPQSQYEAVAAQPVSTMVPSQAETFNVQPQRQMHVTVPPGVAPGGLVQVQTPEGATVQVAVPAGCMPGSVFAMSY